MAMAKIVRGLFWNNHLKVAMVTTPLRCFSIHPEKLPNLSPEQVKVILEKDKKLRDQYLVLEANMTEAERDLNRRKRMIYRSKQRGWLEADLLMGSWAAEHVPNLSSQELDEYEILLQEETIDIYNFISKKDPLPPHLQQLSVMKKLQDYALTRNMASPDGYKQVKERTNLT